MKYQLYNRDEYFEYLINYCNRAGKNDRIIVATMEFRPDQEMISRIVDSLCTASKNGADVTFLVDAYSLMLKNGAILGPMFFSRKDPRKGYGYFKSVVQALDELKNAGVNYVITNKPQRPFKNPFSGRSHIKFAVLNNEVLIGGCNLSNPDQLDVMVKVTNQSLAQYMKEFTQDVVTYKNVRKALSRRDTSFKIDQDTELLIDSGVKRQSLIYDRAFELIKNAKTKVYMTCQYFPNNVTPAALAKAYKRGVGVHLTFNHPDQHRGPIRSVQKRTLAIKKRYMPLCVFENQLDVGKSYLHAKILLSEKEAIIGSHNFVKYGVNLGTAEIALHSTSPELIHSARKWIHSL